MNTKRAEELAGQLFEIESGGYRIELPYGSLDEWKQKAAALLLAEMRKEREAYAEKLTLYPPGKGHSQEYRSGYMAALNKCAAILREEA